MFSSRLLIQYVNTIYTYTYYSFANHWLRRGQLFNKRYNLQIAVQEHYSQLRIGEALKVSSKISSKYSYLELHGFSATPSSIRREETLNPLRKMLRESFSFRILIKKLGPFARKLDPDSMTRKRNVSRKRKKEKRKKKRVFETGDRTRYGGRTGWSRVGSSRLEFRSRSEVTWTVGRMTRLWPFRS